MRACLLRFVVLGLAGFTVLASPLAACRRSTGGEATTGDPRVNPPPPKVGEYGRCFTDECDPGLECVAMGASSFCLQGCASDAACTASQRCLGGQCVRKVGYYEVCGGLDGCPADAHCQVLAPVAPTRCVPVCEVGNLAGFSAVTSCPALPGALTASAPECTAEMLPTSTAKFCTAEVFAGARCDQLALRCNDDDQRPDTDLAAEPASAGKPDPGALRCLPRGAESWCVRVCSADAGQTTSPCACPAGDPLCREPTDPGVAWTCARWTGLNAQLRGCVLAEPCFDDSACLDNAASGMSKCKPSPYDTVAGSICQLP